VSDAEKPDEALDASLDRETIEKRQAAQGQSYWAIVRGQFRKNAQGMWGLWIIVAIVVTAVLAPLLANDRPVVAKYKGDIKFPAFATYVDNWVPWQGMRFWLKSLEVGDRYFPFSEHYEELEGLTWKEARANTPDDFAWSLWPPIEWHPMQVDTQAIKVRPSLESGHLLGTDDQGRDVMARIIHGCVVAITVGVVAMGIATIIGIILGVAAGYFAGRVDMVLSRIVEIVMCFPAFFLIIAVISFVPPSIVNIMIVIGLVRWTGIFRLIRGEVLKSRAQEYVTAAEALGISRRSIMFRHILPNSVAPVFVAVAFGIAGAVLTESGLAFLGFGDVNASSWGEVLKQGREYTAEGLAYLVMAPGIAIFVTLTAFNLFGQGLRDAMDPRLRH
jgi:peptide/nickel transport system permease protein